MAHKQMEMMFLFIVKETWFLKKLNSCSLNVLQRTSSCWNIQALDERISARCSMCGQCWWLHGHKLQTQDWFLPQCRTSQMHQTHEVSENFLPTTLLGYMRNSVMSDKKKLQGDDTGHHPPGDGHQPLTCRSKTQSSTASDGWQLARKLWWLKTQPIVLYGEVGLGWGARGGASGSIAWCRYLSIDTF